MVQVQQVYFS